MNSNFNIFARKDLDTKNDLNEKSKAKFSEVLRKTKIASLTRRSQSFLCEYENLNVRKITVDRGKDNYQCIQYNKNKKSKANTTNQFIFDFITAIHQG